MFSRYCKHLLGLKFLFLILVALIYLQYFTQVGTRLENTIAFGNTSGKPFFVIKTYYYQHSKSFNKSDAVVTLFTAEQFAYGNLTFQCNRILQNGSAEISKGTILDLGVTPPVCKLVLYRLTCLFPPNGMNIKKFLIGVGSVDRDIEYGELTVFQANKKSYKFVSCMSRMVAVDDWAMVIFAMETFRYFGGELAVSPVECAVTEVMDLLRLYEKDGILKIQPGFKPKALTGLGYDPLKETEYANQMSTSHECFYDFKDTAEFISFPDWDDILIVPNTRSKFVTYYDSFAPFITTYPNTAAFNINRFNVFLKTPLRKTDKTFSLATYLQEIEYAPVFIEPKTVIRPHLVAGNWIHESKVKEANEYNQINVNNIIATYAHLHYTLSNNNTSAIPPYSKWHSNASHSINSKVLDTNFRKMLNRHSFTFNNTLNSYNRPFHGHITNCYNKIANDFKANGVTYCPTPTFCKYNPQNVNVVKVMSSYNNPLTTGMFIWHERRATSFVTDNKGCL